MKVNPIWNRISQNWLKNLTSTLRYIYFLFEFNSLDLSKHYGYLISKDLNHDLFMINQVKKIKLETEMKKLHRKLI